LIKEQVKVFIIVRRGSALEGCTGALSAMPPPSYEAEKTIIVSFLAYILVTER
jgi:hypothetical protein